MRDFLFGLTRIWTEDLWISSTAFYHCAMVTAAFHLWQFQSFNLGAEGLVVVLFWLDLWEIFFLASPGFEQRTSGSLVLHSIPVPQHFLISPLIISGIYFWGRGIGGGNVLIGPVRDFHLPTLGFELWTYGSLVLHSTTVPWRHLVGTSDNLSYFNLGQRDWGWYCSDWTCERFSLWPHHDLNWGPLDL